MADCLHYVYKTTNMINNKIYIGIHSQSSNIIDDYLGSGKILQSAIKKYGVDNFKKEIIFIGKTRQDIVDYEKLIVNDDFVKLSETYNLTRGGGNPPCSSIHWVGRKHTVETKSMMSKNRKNKHVGDNHWTKNEAHKESLNNISKAISNRNKTFKPAIGHVVSNECKEKLRKINRDKRWYTNGTIEIFSKEQPNGYTAGRTKKIKKDNK